MKTRRSFFTYLMVTLAAVFAAVAGACGSKPDTVTEPSPEWPPKE